MAASTTTTLAMAAIVFLAVAASAGAARVGNNDKGKPHPHHVEKDGGPILGLPQPIIPPGAMTWCVPRSTASEAALQMCIDFACSQGADCRAIQPGGPCFAGNMTHQASFVMTSYYSKYRPDKNGCDFNGVGHITTVNPSFETCVFP
ncbi:major pollen allergen Ole e 10-like [Andrographis paniculata]|uniref:major pollen allergen Ole e 10-like n=1 Tax=Andrographis paniculata TaxID=175694 RepID=UPI0021E7AA06|nr:major pollen allergen Ole e 10-like [Andrographis paniculata]